MNQKQIDELLIDLSNDNDEINTQMFFRTLNFIYRQMEDGKTTVNIQELYIHLDKMYKKFGI